MVHEIVTRWTAPRMPGGMVSVMYFNDEAQITAQRAALGQLWTDAGAVLHESVSWSVEPTGRVVSMATGQTIGLWTDPANQSGSGNYNTGGPVANATQALIQWRTGVYQNGREARGRTFVPGLSTSALQQGEMTPGFQNSLQSAVDAFVASVPGFSIFSRPKSIATGSMNPVTAGTVWREFAVLRSRRD